MKCLIIHISPSEQTGYDEVRDRIVFSGRHFRSFFEKNGIIEKLSSKISLKCSVCGSFLVPASDLYALVYNPEPLFDQHEYEDWDEEFESFYQTVMALLQNITEEINATEEEWESYQEKGTPQLSPLHLQGEYVDWPDWAERPVRLRFDDVAFKYDVDCRPCNNLFFSA